MNANFIDPGRFNTELLLEEARITRDETGGHVESWEEVAVIFALLEPMRANHRFGADQRLETLTHRITLRYRADLKSGMRLRKRDRIFNILTVHDPDESARYMVCKASEVGR